MNGEETVVKPFAQKGGEVDPIRVGSSMVATCELHLRLGLIRSEKFAAVRRYYL